MIDRIDPGLLADIVIKATSLQEKADRRLREEAFPVSDQRDPRSPLDYPLTPLNDQPDRVERGHPAVDGGGRRTGRPGRRKPGAVLDATGLRFVHPEVTTTPGPATWPRLSLATEEIGIPMMATGARRPKPGIAPDMPAATVSRAGPPLVARRRCSVASQPGQAASTGITARRRLSPVG